MFGTTQRSHVFRLVLATLAVAVFTAAPASADQQDPTICIYLDWPQNICVHVVE